MTRTPMIDWAEARAYYLTLGPTRTFTRVAEKFGVSNVSVGKRARAEGWLEDAHRLDAKAARQVDERYVRDHSARIARHLEMIDRLCSKLLKDVEAGRVEVRPADFPHLVRLEQLLVGEPTDRIEIRQVQQILAAFVRITAENVPPENRAGVLAQLKELEQTFSGQLELVDEESPA